jgi:gluconolactonase
MPPRTLKLATLTAMLSGFLQFIARDARAAAPPEIASHAQPYPKFGSIERLDPALDQLLAADAVMESLAQGFNWSEGPVWLAKENTLVFSDVPENVAYAWRDGFGVSVYLRPSGLTGEPNGAREPGSNGLATDTQGRLLLAQHGDRRIARWDPAGRAFVTVAGAFEGKRFNSPNDLCVDRAGNLYFTDPPYGVGKTAPRELDFQGVYRVSPDGVVTLLTREISRPNGIELSPDERTLYVANSEGKRAVIRAYELREDGTLGPGRDFFDATALQKPGRRGAPDGLSADAQGNLWATGPGGVLIISPDGKHLGTLLTGRATANCCFGGPQGTTLYITADDVLCRIETNVRGRVH